MAVTYEQELQQIVWGRDEKFEFTIYDPDGVTPQAVDGTNDGFTFRVWATDGSSAAITVTKSSSPSVVTVVAAGTSGSVPAQIRVTLDRTATDDLTVGTRYYGELVLTDYSDSNKQKSLCKFPIDVVGTAT